MKVIKARNVHSALPQGIDYLYSQGIQRQSRNGPVFQSPCPVTTVYLKPEEKLVFSKHRDVNTAFLVYEALWMLAGRRDLQPLLRYVSTFGNFSDDGETLHGAYGYRWRNWFGIDQLRIIIDALRENPECRRQVLQMWSAPDDLGRQTKDVPCNDMATFQINNDGNLDMTVFCRSNDIIWGAYFANAFHFGLLLEYMANAIGVGIGVYNQVSVNYHGYLNTLGAHKDVMDEAHKTNPYFDWDRVVAYPIRDNHREVDEFIQTLLEDADSGFASPDDGPEEMWLRPMWAVLRAHHRYTEDKDAQFALDFLDASMEGYNHNSDLVVSMKQWLQRRVKP